MAREYHLCKNRENCARAFYNECSFGSYLNDPTNIEIDNPKSVCWMYEADEKAQCTQYQG